MSIQNFTEGARRAIQSCAQIANDAGAHEVTPTHLLWALVKEESQASEILKRHGIDDTELHIFCPIEKNTAPDDPSKPIPLDFAIFGDQMTRSAEYLEVLQSARTVAVGGGRKTDVGTEHLLYGLTRVASPAREALLQLQFEFEQAEIAMNQPLVSSGPPLEVDFEIRWVDQSQAEIAAAQRVLDAAANRTREGIRVVEDYVRFQLDDSHLSRLLKELRHELSTVLRRLGSDQWIHARNTIDDVGTTINTKSEHARGSTTDVVQANLKRIQEAIRSLEEFSKALGFRPSHPHDVLPPSMFETLRYRSYTLEKAVLQTISSQHRFDDCQLYLLVTEANCKTGLEKVVRSALQSGVRIVQLREKTKSDREIIDLGNRIRQWTRDADAMFIMNDRADLTVVTDADGVHVGQDELSVAEARKIVGSDRLVGVSTHSIEQARQAVLDGASYIGVGPCFASQTKSFSEFAGVDFVQQVAAEISLPWFAIGGISEQNLPTLKTAGATRVAISASICQADNPSAAALNLSETLQSQ